MFGTNDNDYYIEQEKTKRALSLALIEACSGSAPILITDSKGKELLIHYKAVKTVSKIKGSESENKIVIVYLDNTVDYLEMSVKEFHEQATGKSNATD
tara:strand:- start:1 stop:294 length:294 start_codon:yes stop_codon:yes gene_type:complete